MRGRPLLTLTVGRQVALTTPLSDDTARPESWSVRKVRCEACAGEPVVERAATFTPLVHVAVGAGCLPLDWKQRATGDREPGEEG